MVQRMLAELELSDSGGVEAALCPVSSTQSSASSASLCLPPASASSSYSSDTENNQDDTDILSDRVSVSLSETEVFQLCRGVDRCFD